MISITLPIPDRNLSLNGRMHWRAVRKGQQAQQALASYAALTALDEMVSPRIPYLTEKVSVFIDVERKKNGSVWDASACVEACKGYMDGLERLIYTNDQQIRLYAVRWDAKPTGNGLIHLYIRALSEPQGWPVVAWATEEWG